MKKWLALLLALLLMLLSSCGGTEALPPDAEDVTGNTEENNEEEKISSSFGAYRHVIIVGIDGGGTFFRGAETPNIDEISYFGASSHSVKTSIPTGSAQCWGSMLHGVSPALHGLTNTIAGDDPYPRNSPYPSVLRVIREARPDAAVGSISHWNSVNIGIVEDGFGIYKISGYSDADTTSFAVQYIRKEKPTFLFIQLDEADAVGHDKGYNSPEQWEKLRELDGYVGDIFRACQQAMILEDTLLIVTADHGGIGTSHGGDSHYERTVSFFVQGKTVAAGQIGEMHLMDTAAVVLYALGIEAPETYEAKIPVGIFKDVGTR